MNHRTFLQRKMQRKMQQISNVSNVSSTIIDKNFNNQRMISSQIDNDSNNQDNSNTNTSTTSIDDIKANSSITMTNCLNYDTCLYHFPTFHGKKYLLCIQYTDCPLFHSIMKYYNMYESIILIQDQPALQSYQSYKYDYPFYQTIHTTINRTGQSDINKNLDNRNHSRLSKQITNQIIDIDPYLRNSYIFIDLENLDINTYDSTILTANCYIIIDKKHRTDISNTELLKKIVYTDDHLKTIYDIIKMYHI